MQYEQKIREKNNKNSKKYYRFADQDHNRLNYDPNFLVKKRVKGQG